MSAASHRIVKVTLRGFLLVSHGAVLYLMLPLVLANVNRVFTWAYPLGHCGLIVTHPLEGRLACENWAVLGCY